VFAVPAGVLVNILGDIVVPSLMILGESTLQAEMKGKSSISNKEIEQNGEGREYGAMLQKMTNLQKYSLDSQDNAYLGTDSCSKQTGGRPSGIIFDLLSSLSKSFLLQIKKVLPYPSFDKLWLRILHVMGFFLGAPHGYDLAKIGNCNVLRLATEEARDWMKTILGELTSMGVFKDRVGLSIVTHDTIRQFTELGNIKEFD
jgi:hypothetical protein